MGKERDKLIRRLGGIPLSEESPSDAELMERRMAWYVDRGHLPPEVEAVRNLLVGYGTLLSRDSVAQTVFGRGLDLLRLTRRSSGLRGLSRISPSLA